MIPPRRFERQPFLCRVRVEPVGGGRQAEGSTVDICLGGAGLVLPVAPKVGEVVTIGFVSRDPSGAEVVERVEGRVARLLAEPQGSIYRVEFLEPLHRARAPRLVERIESL